MVCYDLKKDMIPETFKQLLEFTTSSEIDQHQIARDFVKELTKEHRTSQQLFIKLLSEIIKEYSNAKCDLRNKASVEWSKKVSEFDNKFPYI